MADGAYLVAAVGLVSVIVFIVFNERKPIRGANKIVDDKIIKETKLLCKNNGIDASLDRICRLRKRKAHLQKDIQNCAATWFITALCLAIYGFSSNPSPCDVEKTTLLIASYIVMLTFSGGMYYILRLLYEIKKINSEASA